MDKALRFIVEVFIFLTFLCLLIDIPGYRIAKERIKDSLDLSTKAAALQVNTDPALISQGIFQIDDTRAKIVFLDLMAKNTGMDQETIKSCMLEYRAINVPGTYINPADNKSYAILNPTFVAPLKFKYRGIMISREIVLSNNFAGGQLKTKIH